MIHRDPILGLRARSAHLAIKEIALDSFRLALARIAISSGSRQAQAHEVARLQRVEAFRLQPSLVPRAGIQQEFPGRAVMPAEQPTRRDPVAVGVAGKAHGAGQHADIAAERKAAAVFAGAAAVADELIALDAYGKALLHGLDGSIHEAGQMAVLTIGAVGVGAAAV